MSKVQTIIDQLKDLTLLEASELVSLIEETFDVTASAPTTVVSAAASTESTGTAQVEEKTEFNVKVTTIPADKKIAVIKVVKTILNIGLADAKTKVESAPFVLAENIKKELAEDYKKQLVESGAGVELE